MELTNCNLTKNTETLEGQNGKTHNWHPYHNRCMVLHKAQDFFLSPSRPEFQQRSTTKSQGNTIISALEMSLLDVDDCVP